MDYYVCAVAVVKDDLFYCLIEGRLSFYFWYFRFMEDCKKYFIELNILTLPSIYFIFSIALFMLNLMRQTINDTAK